MQKSLNQSMMQKFPDSDRGEAKGRATFLGGEQDEQKETKEGSFTSLTLQTMSPTKGDKSPFSKTPREKVGSSQCIEDDDGNSEKRKGSREEEKHGKGLGGLGKLLFSKARNKRQSLKGLGN